MNGFIPLQMERLPYNDRLIEQVRNFPCLYNQDRRVFVDSKERNILWQRIAMSIDPTSSGEFAKRRWLQIRDRYRKELRATLKGELIMGARWKHFNRLSWLDPHLKNLDLQRSEDDTSGDQSMESSSNQSTSSPQQFILNGDIKLESLLQNNECEESLNPLGYLNLSLFNSLLSDSSSNLVNDEYFLFARIIGLRLKRMDPIECRRIQSNIMTMLDEEEKKSN
ncbi:madf-5 [Pristionchus pacificus]|uniref:Madf-5 n=1 Tax=Pristionchus pacificus TaxID=54126 RepID=A0A2A6D3B9_PRIPA|nr:madf-5 [Pristionchus pacificus]|eukprot:PDM84888.1 madf-5 [Pristionchus pacificus]